MAYQSGIPLATDKLSVSQGDILNNFTAINTYVNVNHVAFNGADQGKHNMVTFVDQAAVPVAAGTERIMYLATDPAFPLLNQQLWLQDSSADYIPLTACNPATGGFTYFASGVVLAWAQVTWVASGNNTQDLDTTAFGASFPGFGTAVFNVQMTSRTASNAINVVSVGAGPTYTLTYNVTATTGSAYISVIGI